MVRLFKSGDRVQQKNGGPVMIVQKYAREYKPWIGWCESKYAVECVWYDARGERKKEIVHQNNLIKTSAFSNVGITAPPLLQQAKHSQSEARQ